MKQGLWGIVSESALGDVRHSSSPEFSVLAANESTGPSMSKFAPAKIDSRAFTAAGPGDSPRECHEIKYHLAEAQGGESEMSPEKGGNETPSSSFAAWAPLPSVTDRYAHHALARRRKMVICLTDSGVLHTYAFKDGSGAGEARRKGSWETDLRANGTTATCLCLLPKTPAFVTGALGRLVVLHSGASANFGTSRGVVVGEDGGGDELVDDLGDGSCCSADAMGGSDYGEMLGLGADHKGMGSEQVVAIGTSQGDIFLVETAFSGTISPSAMLDVLYEYAFLYQDGVNYV